MLAHLVNCTSSRVLGVFDEQVIVVTLHTRGFSHGGKWDILAGAMLREDSARFTDIYRPGRRYLDWHREKVFVA